MRVSILIPCFNAETFIRQCIDSALAQDWADKEVIVVDDGSSDGSLAIIGSFGNRIRFESGPNRGANAARNRLLELSSGEWLQYLDADDYLRPRKIAGQARFAQNRPRTDVICSPTVWEKTQDGKTVFVESKFPASRDPWTMLALWQLPQTGGALWKRAAMQAVGGWRIDQPCCHEHELYGRLLETGCHFEFLDECLAVYRDWDHGVRLTKKLIDEVERQRLIILTRTERFLRAGAEFTAARRQAINDARHQVARKLWQKDCSAALAVIRQIAESDAAFCPTEGPSSPPAYRLAYRTIGFRGAQRLADTVRKLNPHVAGPMR